MSVLSSLVSGISQGTIEVVDLTAPLSEKTPILLLPEPFANTITFSLEELSRYDERGPAWYWNNIHTGEHTGTHFDAPVHCHRVAGCCAAPAGTPARATASCSATSTRPARTRPASLSSAPSGSRRRRRSSASASRPSGPTPAPRPPSTRRSPATPSCSAPTSTG